MGCACVIRNIIVLIATFETYKISSVLNCFWNFLLYMLIQLLVCWIAFVQFLL